LSLPTGTTAYCHGGDDQSIKFEVLFLDLSKRQHGLTNQKT
jgi:hypothetical protein